MAELVDLNGEPREGVGLTAPDPVLLNHNTQVRAPIESGPAHPRAGGDFGESDGSPGSSKVITGGLNPGDLVWLHAQLAWDLAIRRSSRSRRRR